jgi:hypothetical protein
VPADGIKESAQQEESEAIAWPTADRSGQHGAGASVSDHYLDQPGVGIGADVHLDRAGVGVAGGVVE